MLLLFSALVGFLVLIARSEQARVPASLLWSLESQVDEILTSTPLIDTHNDMPIKLYFTYENKIAYRNLSQLEKHQSGWTGFNTDLSRLQAGRAGAVFWSAYVNCKDFQIQSSSVRDTLAQIGTSASSRSFILV